jgi:Uma2 family endonuclease
MTAFTCPDFVLELRSPSDDLPQVQAKLREYIENGARLGWLLNPQDQQVKIYRANGSVEVLTAPNLLSGEALLPGFELSLKWLWQSKRK